MKRIAIALLLLCSLPAIAQNFPVQQLTVYGTSQFQGAMSGPQLGSPPYFELWDDFFTVADLGNMVATAIGSASGQSCTGSSTYVDINHPGNLLLATGTGGSGTGIACGMQNQLAIVSPNATPGWTWQTLVYVPVLPGTTAGSYQAGMANAPLVQPWTTGLGFQLSSANGTANDWYCRYSSTSTDTTVGATAATWTQLRMVNDGTYIHWYINGTEATACKIALATAPSSTQYPANFTAAAGSATSVTMAVDYVQFYRQVTR